MGAGSSHAQIAVDLEFEVNGSTVKQASVFVDALSMDRSNELTEQAVLVELPFRLPKDFNPPENSEYAVVTTSDFQYLLVAVKPGSTQESRVPVDIDLSSDLLIQIRQFTAGLAIIVPADRPKANSIVGLRDASRIPLIQVYRKVVARFPAGYSVVHSDRIEKLLAPDNFELRLESSRREYIITFNRPITAFEANFDEVFARIIIVLLALLVAFASPGFVPEVYLKHVLIGTSVLLLIFLIGRWVFGFRKDDPSSAIFDTLSAIVYALGLGVVWYVKRRR